MSIDTEVEKTEFKVEVIKLGKVTKHPNADKLDLTEVNGAMCVMGIGQYKEGDVVVYVPIDSLVPTDRPEFSFLAKEGRTHHRVRAMRLKGIFSMGLIVSLPKEAWMEGPGGAMCFWYPGDDVAKELGVLKYESPQEKSANAASARRSANISRYKGPKLPVYGLDPLRKYSGIFNDGEMVIVTEKIHGSNARFVFNQGKLHVGSHRMMRGSTPGKLKVFFERLWIKLKSLLGIKHRAHTLAETGDIWWQTAAQYNLKERLSHFPNIVLFGEVYGEGVQYLTYDSPVGRKFLAFDAYDLTKGEYLSWEAFNAFIGGVNGVAPGEKINIVPGIGTYSWSTQLDKDLRFLADTLKSRLAPGQIGEGVVVKPMIERRDNRVGRVAMKYAGQGYHLDKKGE